MIKILDFNEKFSQPIVLCLGFFDSIHLGHNEVFSVAKTIAEKVGAKCAVFTFKNDVGTMLCRNEKQVFTFCERLARLERISIPIVIAAKANADFLAIESEKFLDSLFLNFNITGIVSGIDYKFGHFGSGNCKQIEDYAKAHNVEFRAIDLLKIEDEKVSTTRIRNLLKAGNVEKCNKLLTFPYSITGCIIEGRKDGRKIGFPTANVNIDKAKFLLQSAVYFTAIEIDGKFYKAVSNIGTHPTFDDFNENIESFILDFRGDIYGKTVEIIFIDKIRDTKKFNSIEELVSQIKKDVAFAEKKELVW